jgi:hypothetical protein
MPVSRKSATKKSAAKTARKSAAKKSTRCWPGYEPVEGKKQHEQGSCRPKAKSKLTSSEKSFRKKRRKQLDTWEAHHPQTRKSASQHLHAPGAKKKSSSRRAA